MKAALRPHPSGDELRGQALVEFALVLPALILLLVGLFDAGRLVYAYNVVNNAAREAGRVAIVDQTQSHIEAEAVRQASGLGLRASNVTITYRNFDDSASCSPPDVGCLAVVKVTYNYTAVMPVVGQLLRTVAVSGTTKFPIEATCVEGGTLTCPKGSP